MQGKDGLYDQIFQRFGSDEDAGSFVLSLNNRMKLYGVSRSLLARTYGTSKGSVGNWLSGRKRPALETRVKLSEALDDIIKGKAA